LIIEDFRKNSRTMFFERRNSVARFDFILESSNVPLITLF
jgi:hypothetical protein